MTTSPAPCSVWQAGSRLATGGAEMAEEVAVWGPVDHCLDELSRHSAAGADLIIIAPVFDHIEHIEALSPQMGGISP